MSMFDDVVLGLGRTGYVNESVEPELQDEEFDSIEGLDESVDPMEYITNAIYANEMNMSNLDKAIMCEEYMYLREHGTEMVYEAANIKSIIDSAKAMILSVWNKIKNFLKTQTEKIAGKIEKSFLDKYKEKALKGRSGQIKGYSDFFAKGSDSGLNGIVKDAKDSFELLNKLAAKVTEYAAKLAATKGSEDPKVEEFKERVDFAVKGMSDVNATIEKESQKTITVSAERAIEVFTGIMGVKTKIKEFYNNSKKVVDSELKAIKQLERTYKNHKVFSTEESKKVHGCIRMTNMIGTAIATLNRLAIRQISMAKAQSKAAIIAAAANGARAAAADANSKSDQGSAAQIQGPTSSGSTAVAVRNSAVKESAFISGLTIF